MKKIQMGDVFEITTPKGKGYFQYVFNNKTMSELIRILPGLYLEQPENMVQVVARKEIYFVHFPLKAAYRKGIVKLVGKYDLPEEMEFPKKMRTDYVDKFGSRICWHVIDYNTWKRESVKEVTEEQKKLSPWGIWNDTFLIERLAEGWTPEKWM